jgi:prepilin-type N-terminal cleavage/methylation domain-containing protein
MTSAPAIGAASPRKEGIFSRARRLQTHPSMRRGFTLIDVMIAIAIAAVLAAIASQEFEKMLSKARRTEAVVGLHALWTAETAYHIHAGRYASTFDALGGFPLEGIQRISPATAKARLYTFHLSQPWGQQSFYCVAAGQLDPDPWPDLLTIEEGRQ